MTVPFELLLWLAAAALAVHLGTVAAAFAAHLVAYRAYRRRYPAAPRRSVWRSTK